MQRSFFVAQHFKSFVMNPRFAPATRLVWKPGVLGALDVIAKHGFGASEVWAQHLWESQVGPEAVAKHAQELGLTLSLHAPSYDLNSLSSNIEIRGLSRRQVLASLETAARMGASIVVVHPGHVSSSTDDVEEYWLRLQEFLEELHIAATQHGVRVAIEAMEKKKLQFVTNLAALQRLGAMLGKYSGQIGIALDIAHAHGQGDSSVLNYIAQTPQLVHAHLSDSSNSKTHALLGDGEMDLKKIIPALLTKFNGLIAIEGRNAKNEELALNRASTVLKNF